MLNYACSTLIPMTEDMEFILTKIINANKLRLNNEISQKMFQTYKPWEFDVSDLGTQYHANLDEGPADMDLQEFETDSR